MKTIGLIGGLSWQSTALYYRYINEWVASHGQALSSAKIVLSSVDFRDFANWQHVGNWQAIGDALAEEAQRLCRAGVDVVAVASNTMHKVAAPIQVACAGRFYSITKAITDHIKTSKIQSVTLLGTRFTMSEDFFVSALREGFAGEIAIPDESQQNTIHNIIFNELCQGQVKAASQQEFKSILASMLQSDGYLLACTELGMLSDGLENSFNFLDTTKIHAQALAAWSIADH